MLFQQIWMDLKESMNTSYYTSFIYLSIGAILNTSPLLEIYIKISDKNNYQQNQLYLILDSLNVGKYLLKSSIVHSIYILIIFAFNIYIIILFIILYYVKKKNVQTNVAYSIYGQIIGYLIQPYFWSINGFLFQIQNTYLEQIQNLTFFFIDCIAIILQLLFLIILILFLQYDYSQKKNFLKINSPKTLICQILTVYFKSCLELFINTNKILNISFPIILVLLFILLFTQMHQDLPVFSNKQLNNYFQILVSIQFALALNLLISCFVNIFEDRYCLLVILALVFLIQLNSKIRQYLILKSISNYSTTKMIDQRTIVYLKQNPQNLFLLRGIIQLHQSLCSNINCFYRLKTIYKISSKGNKKIYINRDTINENIGRISTFFLKCIYESSLTKKQDQSTNILLIELLCYKLKLYPESLMQVEKLNQDKLNLIQRINIANIRLIISRIIKQKNVQAYKSKLPFDHLLLCESYIKETVQIIMNIFGYQLQFWNYLLNEEIKLIEELFFLKKISIQIKKFLGYSKQILSLHKNQKVPIRNKQWFNYFFFKLFILNKKLKLSELEILPDYQLNLDQILKDDQIDEKSSDEEPTNYYQQKFLVSGNTFVIQINQSGMIKNSTNNVFQILNYNKQSLVNSSATVLMPQMFKQYHSQFVNHFEQSGQSFNLYKRKKAFCMHDSGYIIIVYKYLKFIYNYNSNQIEYIAMFRQIQTKQQYLLLNEDWEVDSCTQLIQDIIGIKSLSLFILAPKTIVYSQYEKFLNQENKEFFSLNVPNLEKNLSRLFYTQHSSPLVRGSITSSNEQISILQNQVEIKKSFQNFLNQDDVINVEDQHKQKVKQVLFNLRVPKQKYELVQDFQQRLSESYKQAIYNEPFRKQLIVKNQSGKYKIVRSEFIRRCKVYQEIIRKEKFQIIKELFQKYTQSEECIEKILRVEGTLKLEKTSQSIKYILIKIVRTEVIEENPLPWRENSCYTLSLQTHQNQMISSQQTKKTIITQQSPRNLYSIVNDQFDLYSNRESTGKILLQEVQVNQDFDQNDHYKNINFTTCNSNLLKEDTNKIEKDNPSIIQYVYISRIIFILQILIAFMSFFLTSFIYNKSTLEDSVILVDYLFQFQIIVAESYNAQIDIELFNRNYTFSQLTNGDLIGFQSKEQFYEYNKNVTQKCADFMYLVFWESNFLKMLYENFYNNSTESGLDIQTVYQLNIYLLNMLSTEEFREDFGITETFHNYMLPQFQQIQATSINHLLNQGLKFQEISNSNYILFLILQTILQIASLMYLVRFQFQIQKQYNVLFRIQAIIPFKEKIAVIEKLNTTINQFCYITKYEYGDLGQFLSINKQNPLSQAFQMRNNNSKNQFEKNLLDTDKYIEQYDNKAKIKFEQLSLLYSLKQIATKIIVNLFLIALISIAGFIAIYLTINNIELFNQNQFMFDSLNVWTLPAIKEIATSQIYQDYQFNDTNAIKILQFYVEQIQSEFPVFYKTNINEINSLFNNNICDEDTDMNIEQCNFIVNGALNRGIREYDYLLSQVVLKVLNPNDERFENITYKTIYEFNKLYYFVFDHYLLAKNIWVQVSQATLDKHDQVSLILLIIVIIGICLYFLIFNEIGYVLFKKKEYKFIKMFYKSYMPNVSINHQKRLRVELIKARFIRK
ncbi:unnamed protein product [Paramecium sonneborni]|uniref:Transmembrane protein n=1 Tax=Paramecium sonneborni TaxID=65129 RepID=A0A8S1MW73_9CILI|nr:unnamed protein product [Paramecium sonneborni]